MYLQVELYEVMTSARDGRFGSKVGQIGPQMGQIWGFFRSDFSAFGAPDRDLPYMVVMPSMSSLGSLNLPCTPIYQGYMRAEGSSLWASPRAWPNSWAATMNRSIPGGDREKGGQGSDFQSKVGQIGIFKDNF